MIYNLCNSVPSAIESGFPPPLHWGQALRGNDGAPWTRKNEGIDSLGSRLRGNDWGKPEQEPFCGEFFQVGEFCPSHRLFLYQNSHIHPTVNPVKLATKIVAVCFVAMILVTALSSYLLARREFQRVKEYQQGQAARVGNLIRESAEVAYNQEGHQGIVSAIRTQTVEAGGLRYRWVWFDVSANDADSPTASLDSLEKILEGQMDSVVQSHGQQRDMHTYFPIDINDRATGRSRSGAIEVSGSLESVEQEAWRVVKTGLLAMASMALFCFAFVAWAGIRLIGRPLNRLAEQTRIIGDGVYDQPLELNTHDEFSQLATALNGMADRIADQQRRIETESMSRVAALEQLRHADRLKTVGRLAAGIAHEIGTPLNVISGRAGLIRGGKLNSVDLRESATAIESESNRIAGILRQLLDFARQNPPHRISTDVRVVVEQTTSLLQTMANKHGVQLETEFDDNASNTAFIDPSRIQQVLTNLIVNAIQAMPEDQGTVRISIMGLADEPSRLQVRVTDNGPGINAETVKQIFEPFFTTKEVGQGTGLGLSIAHEIIQEHGGTIEVDSRPGRGTTFAVSLPRQEFQ